MVFSPLNGQPYDPRLNESLHSIVSKLVIDWKNLALARDLTKGNRGEEV